MFSFSWLNTNSFPVPSSTRRDGGPPSLPDPTCRSVKTPCCLAMSAAATVTGDGHFKGAQSLYPTRTTSVAAGSTSVVILNTKLCLAARARLE